MLLVAKYERIWFNRLMNPRLESAKYLDALRRFAPTTNVETRSAAIFSGAIALGDEKCLRQSIKVVGDLNMKMTILYEMVLQSYLFLGFPRMLNAARVFHEHHLPDRKNACDGTITAAESRQWYRRGETLCRRIYDDKYERLKQSVQRISPEAFRWMINEGYGKVLSRTEADIVTREAAIIVCLMVDNQPRQLRSHIRGAINVGASVSLLDKVISDIGSAAGDGYGAARSILEKLVAER